MTFQLAAALALALLLAIVGYRRPKIMVGVVLLVILFGPTVQTVTGIRALSYSDEAVVALAFVVVMVRPRGQNNALRSYPGVVWFVGFALFGVLSAIVRHVPFTVTGEGTVLAVKGVVFGLTVARLEWKQDAVEKLARAGAVLSYFVLGCGVLNLIDAKLWNSIFATTAVQYRVGLPSLIGPFGYPASFGRFTALAAIAVVSYRSCVRRTPGSALLAGGLFLGSVLSFRRKTIAGVIAALLVVRLRTSRLNTAVAVLLLLPIMLVALWEPLTSVADETYNSYIVNRSARVVVTTDSFNVANGYFPFGAGFGRFGSDTARVHYSPEYIKRGYPNIYGLGQRADDSSYLTDTQWPAILGEAGYLGAIAFIGGLVLVLREFLKASRAANPYVRWVGVCGLGWLLQIIIESVASPVFTSPPTYPLLFGAAGLSVALRKSVGDVEPEPEPELVDEPDETPRVRSYGPRSLSALTEAAYANGRGAHSSNGSNGSNGHAASNGHGRTVGPLVRFAPKT